jgi:hypothetical protein
MFFAAGWARISGRAAQQIARLRLRLQAARPPAGHMSNAALAPSPQSGGVYDTKLIARHLPEVFGRET